MKNNLSYEYLKENNLIIYEVVSGSRAYGTNLPNSDTDIRYVYVLPINYILSNNIIEQVNDKKNDIVGYEIGRFVELLSTANPNILEFLNIPSDCVISKHKSFDIILKNREKFITKRCKDTFTGYAITQIKKAKGQDKKQNWEKERVKRKTPIDFCYVIEENKSIKLKKWAEVNNMSIDFTKDYGLVKVPNSKDIYCMYYEKGSNYKGLIKNSNRNTSNQLRLSSIPKGKSSVGIISYNENGYVKHCKDYNSYKKWLTDRNEDRWVENKESGQKIDGKNMLHCKRLLDMSIEIAKGEGVIVRRPNSDKLIDIRKGKVDLDTLIKESENNIKEIDTLFDKSNLPNSVNKFFAMEMTFRVRKSFYFNLKKIVPTLKKLL